MRTTNLKEIYIVRYADDFRIFCRTRKQAVRAKQAITLWLQERLKLQVSEEKTRITNCKRNYMEFLGIKVKVTPKQKKYVVTSHVSDKKRKALEDKLVTQIKVIQKPKDGKDVQTATIRYNQIVIGEHNYYSLATNINGDMKMTGYRIKAVMKNRLGTRLTKEKPKGKILNEGEKKYAKSKELRYDKATGIPILPISYIQYKNPMGYPYGVTPYTKKERAKIHKNLEMNPSLMHKLAKSRVYRGTVAYADNRISRFPAQHGKCAITGIEFQSTSEIHCHHIKPKQLGGTDEYENLILVHDLAHKLIHAKRQSTIQKYLKILKLNKKQLAKVNELRKSANLEVIG